VIKADQAHQSNSTNEVWEDERLPGITARDESWKLMAIF
jgi:hypothetical protein